MEEYIGTYQGREPEGHVLMTPDGGRIVLEPAAILDARLPNVPLGVKVKVVKTGGTVPTKAGRRAAEYRVLVAKGSLDAVRRAAVALLGGTPEEPPPVPPVDRDAIRRALFAEAERRRAEEQERERQVAWLRKEAALLGYRLVRRKAPAP